MNSQGKEEPIPLSQARSKKRNHRIETNEEQLRSLLTDIVQEHVSAKISRLETSIDRMVSRFEAIQNGDSDDAALRVTTDHEDSDLASVYIDIPTEEHYIYKGVVPHPDEIRSLGLKSL